MRILLTSSASHVPPRGGSTRSNLVWLEYLESRGHDCRIVAPALARDTPQRSARIEAELTNQRIRVNHVQTDPKLGFETLKKGDITVYSVENPARLRPVLRQKILKHQPDWVLVSSEDLGQALLREAQHSAPGRVVYLAHTPQMFPFGPASLNPNPSGRDLVARAAGIVAIGNYTAGYIEKYLGRRPAVIHPPVYGPGPYDRRDPEDGGLITLINASAVKGIGIFLELARHFPEYEFGALHGWGTTDEDFQALRALPNVTLLPKVKHIETILKKTRVLLVPSLWPEGFGLVVTQAMLMGVPVLASDLGGLVEARAGARYILPVRPIERYRTVFDENHMPAPVIPEQDIEPWARALRELMTDRDLYRREADSARDAALRFVSSVRPSQFEDFLFSLRPYGPEAPVNRPLRILLAQNSPYYPAHGGGDRSNRLLLEALSKRGHTCQVVARAQTSLGEDDHRRYLDELARRSVRDVVSNPSAVSFPLNGVNVHVVTRHPNLRAYFNQEIAAFAPDAILASTDDPTMLFIEIALKSPPARVVYLTRTTLALPFGPECAIPSEEKTQRLRHADGVVAVSDYVANYIRTWSGIEATSLPISPLDPGPYPEFGSINNEFVTMINPCAVKGISIFLALADRMPGVAFAAVPTWGTTTEDLAALARRPNVRLLEPADNIDDILRRTRVVLVPSLWAEARGRIVVEAMLRAIPVLASDIGGIPEAKLGVDYLLPVRPITSYQHRVDAQMVPVAEVPEQDIGPWEAALAHVLSSPERYDRLARQSRNAALAHAASLSVEPFERYLAGVARSPVNPTRATGKPAGPETVASAFQKLSPERRALLAARMKRKAAGPARAGSWFPTLREDSGARLRLFCFPYAGGGASVFRTWANKLPAGVEVCPARLPGRETRAAESPFDRIDAMVEALSTAMRPHLNIPYALFGHSMGAMIAFELARRFRTQGWPAPAMLVVAAARAPQFRQGHAPPPEPSEEEFLDELRRLEGAPQSLLANEELLKLALPALRADASLCRVYSYHAEPPLDCPIVAYVGAEDPRLPKDVIEPWREQTTGRFDLRIAPGGHFFIWSSEGAFLDLLAADLEEFGALSPI